MPSYTDVPLRNIRSLTYLSVRGIRNLIGLGEKYSRFARRDCDGFYVVPGLWREFSVRRVVSALVRVIAIRRFSSDYQLTHHQCDAQNRNDAAK